MKGDVRLIRTSIPVNLSECCAKRMADTSNDPLTGQDGGCHPDLTRPASKSGDYGRLIALKVGSEQFPVFLATFRQNRYFDSGQRDINCTGRQSLVEVAMKGTAFTSGSCIKKVVQPPFLFSGQMVSRKVAVQYK